MQCGQFLIKCGYLFEFCFIWSSYCVFYLGDNVIVVVIIVVVWYIDVVVVVLQGVVYVVKLVVGII